MPAWDATLEAALAAEPDHISVYDLSIEENTAYGRWAGQGRLEGLPEHAASAAMLARASEVLRVAGYEHYEVSNFALPGHRSRHNQAYWQCASYFGFGLGATSFVRGLREERPRSLSAYCAWVAEMSQKKLPANDAQAQDAMDEVLEVVMLAMRRADGLDLDALALAYGADAATACLRSVQEHVRNGLVLHGGAQGELGTLRLAVPDGFLVYNAIVVDIFAELESVAIGGVAAPASGDTLGQ